MKRNAQEDLEMCNQAKIHMVLPYWINDDLKARELLKELFDLLRHEELPSKQLHDQIKEFLGGWQG
jgi:hypothetical protein